MTGKRMVFQEVHGVKTALSVYLGSVYTNAVSNRHGFMPLKPHRKRYGFKAITRCQSHRFQVLKLCQTRSQALIIEEEDLGSIITPPSVLSLSTWQKIAHNSRRKIANSIQFT